MYYLEKSYCYEVSVSRNDDLYLYITVICCTILEMIPNKCLQIVDNHTVHPTILFHLVTPLALI
jgi:hypothetical protein